MGEPDLRRHRDCLLHQGDQPRRARCPTAGCTTTHPSSVAVTAHCLLRTFFGGATGWNGRADALTPREIQRIPTPSRDVDTAGGPLELSEADEALLAELARDGRTGYGRLAAATGWSESTAQRRLEHLRRAGVLFFDVDIDPGLLGFSCVAMLWLSVPPSQLARVGMALAAHAEVAFAAATTGPTNLVISVGCRDVEALYDYVDTRLGALGAIHHMETAPVIHTAKRTGAVLDL